MKVSRKTELKRIKCDLEKVREFYFFIVQIIKLIST